LGRETDPMTDTRTITSSYDQEHDPHGHAHEHHPTVAVYLSVFVVLLVLLVATVLAAEMEFSFGGKGHSAGIGTLNFVVAAAIASVKAVLIILFFMHVRYSTPLTWLVAGAGFFWLAILFGLTLADYFTRTFTPFSEQ
jgi:cytochrome c oxidase subunit 4